MRVTIKTDASKTDKGDTRIFACDEIYGVLMLDMKASIIVGASGECNPYTAVLSIADLLTKTIDTLCNSIEDGAEKEMIKAHLYATFYKRILPNMEQSKEVAKGLINNG